MSEKTLIYNDTAYRVVLRDYKEASPLGKTLQNEVCIMSKDYITFCKIVEFVQGVFDDEWETG